MASAFAFSAALARVTSVCKSLSIAVSFAVLLATSSEISVFNSFSLEVARVTSAVRLSDTFLTLLSTSAFVYTSALLAFPANTPLIASMASPLPFSTLAISPSVSNASGAVPTTLLILLSTSVLVA